MQITRLYLRECPKSVLNNLPENMEVRGKLDLYATEIKSLPEGLKVGEWLDLGHCVSLKSLPRGLKVGGELELYNCNNLQSLPEGLKVGGGLSLKWCTSLQSLPEGLKVGGWLSLYYCKSLQILPDDLKVGDDIFINPDDEGGTGVSKEDFPKRLWNQIKEY